MSGAPSEARTSRIHQQLRRAGGLALAALLSFAARADDDSQYRLGLNLKLVDTERADFSGYAEFRASDSPVTPLSVVLSGGRNLRRGGIYHWG